jgi:hypothetical protein
VFAADLHRAGSHVIAELLAGRERKHGKLISRSSAFCFLKGNAGVSADIAVTCAPDKQRSYGGRR